MRVMSVVLLVVGMVAIAVGVGWSWSILTAPPDMSAALSRELVQARSNEDELRQAIELAEARVMDARSTESYLRRVIGEKTAEICFYMVIVPGVGVVIPYGELAREPVPPEMQAMFMCGSGIEYVWPAPAGVPVQNLPDGVLGGLGPTTDEVY